ncbi:MULTISPECIES: hypothetical protein [unclassified Amycolatopsis]|jgi:hypothetical protein|uniref:hypothetical protein n=1 Tax=unclassified Amycolatopsis TaxID=2618356 RepID=UPI002E1EC5A9|nr:MULTISPECIES: hypothetical protein [unclassified Amycolatopsis]
MSGGQIARTRRGLVDLRSVALVAVAADGLLTVASFSLLLAVSLAQALTILAGVVVSLRRAGTKLDGILREELGSGRRLATGTRVVVAAGRHTGKQGEVVDDKPVPGPGYVRVRLSEVDVETLSRDWLAVRD